MTSSMAWYPLPQGGGGTKSPGDEFFVDNQSAGGWSSLWSFSTTSEDQDATDRREDVDEGPSEGQSHEGPQFPQPTEDIFLSQFSEEEMKRMDAPFEALDMFPDSMHRLLSYENMLSGVLTGGGSDEEGDEKLDRNGVDTMDTCGFPLFSHGLQNGPRINSERSTNPEVTQSEDDKAVLTMTKRGRPVSDAAESVPGFESLVLEELEDVVFQLTKRTRICYRDAFYRLAESSRANCSSTAKGAADEAGSSISRQSSQQPDSNASRFSTTPGCPERETNPIDRTVMVLTMNAPHQLHETCFPDESGAEAQSTTSWTTRA